MKRAFSAAVAAALAAAIAAAPAHAQTQTKTGFTGVGFTSIGDIKGESLEDVIGALRENTVLTGETVRPVQIVFVYGIARGETVYDPVVSEPVMLVPGENPYIGRGGGPLASPWDAYQDPLLGFEDPLLGFDAFADPVVDFEDPALGFESIRGFEDPALGLEAIWGTGNVGIDPGDHGLVLFTMPDPSAPPALSAEIRHSAALVPFSVREG